LFCDVASTCSAFLAAISACTHCIWLNCGIREEVHRTKHSVVKNFVYFFWLQFSGKVYTDEVLLDNTLVMFNAIEVLYHVRPFECISSQSGCIFYLVKPTGHVMHHQFNIQQLYALSTLYLCVLYLSENKQRLVPLTA
jgi:hypothetical protein